MARAAAGKPPSSSAVGSTNVTHPERVIDASTGITKLELVRYYESIADWMVPQRLRGEPAVDCELVEDAARRPR